MTTLVIEDASRELQAQIVAAKAKRTALGITPMERRPVSIGNAVALLVDPSIPLSVLARALRSEGLAIINEGGRQVVRRV